MQVAKLDVDRDRAKDLYRQYQSHKHHQQPHDEEIAAIYRHIARGQTVIAALQSIVAAGVNAEGMPKLAIMRADQPECWLQKRHDGLWFTRQRGYPEHRQWSTNIPVPWPDWKNPQPNKDHKAIVPLIPIHLRPKRGIQNYAILWEAEWHSYPTDPYLLRRIGRSDAWVVCAAWDLTSVERAVMSARLRQ